MQSIPFFFLTHESICHLCNRTSAQQSTPPLRSCLQCHRTRRLFTKLAMTTVFKFEDAERHKEKGDCWIIIGGKVYDVSKFAEEHPGGDQVLFAATGKDATDDFEDIGHSAGARELMAQFVMGDIDVTTLPAKHDVRVTPVVAKGPSDILITVLQFLIPLTILVLALAVRFLTNDPKSAPSS